LLIAIIWWFVRRQSKGTVALANSRADLIYGQEALVAELRQQITQRDEKQRTLQEQLLALNQRNGELGADLKSLNERLTTERQQLETIRKNFARSLRQSRTS